MKSGPKVRPRIERFWNHISTEPISGCWLWTGMVDRGGYAYMAETLGNGKYERIRVMRWIYQFFKGPIPAKLVLDHLCRVRCCCNPDHLEPVTIRENVMRGNTVPARMSARTKCSRGHEYTTESTYLWRGSRRCRRCYAINAKNLRDRRAKLS